jgi:hypothetical protein
VAAAACHIRSSASSTLHLRIRLGRTALRRLVAELATAGQLKAELRIELGTQPPILQPVYLSA